MLITVFILLPAVSTQALIICFRIKAMNNNCVDPVRQKDRILLNIIRLQHLSTVDSNTRTVYTVNREKARTHPQNELIPVP